MTYDSDILLLITTLNIVQNAEPTVADPEGLIPGWTSYRVHFTTSLGPDTTIRIREIDAASAIS